MRRLARPQRKPPADGTIALINIVFLMLIFFLIAGTLAPPLDGNVTLIAAREAERAEPPDALAAHADGSLFYRGASVTPRDFVAGLGPGEPGAAPVVRLAPDRDLPAAKLIDIVAALRKAGAGTVRIVMERADP